MIADKCNGYFNKIKEYYVNIVKNENLLRNRNFTIEPYYSEYLETNVTLYKINIEKEEYKLFDIPEFFKTIFLFYSDKDIFVSLNR